MPSSPATIGIMPPDNPLWGPDWSAVRANWTLDPEIAFLNHGSFGATPRPVLDAQNHWRAEMERQPVRFLDRDLPGLVREAIEPVGKLLRTDPRNLAFVPNATTGVNSVVRSLHFDAGDELLIADHGYPAIVRTLHRIAERCGAKVVLPPIPFPQESTDEIADAVLAGITDRTRFVLVDHVASPTGLIFPVKRIVEQCRERGIAVMVDAAHGPGMLPIDLDALQPDYWTGNLHKWVCAPKGAAVLYVRPDRRQGIVPAVTSHYFTTGFPDEFIWMGTDDPTAYLAAPEAIRFMDSLGWPRIHAHNHALARYGRRIVSERLGTSPPIPDSPSFYGSMSLVALPETFTLTTRDEAAEFTGRFFDEHRIEVPFVPFRGRVYVRLSAQVYNHPAEYERLAEALCRVVAAT